jgi:HAD superfamily hydrolase (TIGR01509 family)
MSNPPRSNGRYHGVLLDIDGTLVDSNEAHVEAWAEALAENGHAIGKEKIRRLIGMGGDNFLPAAAGIDQESALGKRIAERHGELFKERLPRLRPFPGVRPLLEKLKAEGLKQVVASSAQPDEVKALLEIAGVTDLIEDTADSGDAASSKPDPDIVQAALARLQLSPREVVLLGDTPWDVEAAGRAGVATIAVRSGGFRDEDLKGAIALYDDAADLLARYASSPLGRSS